MRPVGLTTRSTEQRYFTDERIVTLGRGHYRRPGKTRQGATRPIWSRDTGRRVWNERLRTSRLFCLAANHSAPVCEAVRPTMLTGAGRLCTTEAGTAIRFVCLRQISIRLPLLILTRKLAQAARSDRIVSSGRM